MPKLIAPKSKSKSKRLIAPKTYRVYVRSSFQKWVPIHDVTSEEKALSLASQFAGLGESVRVRRPSGVLIEGDWQGYQRLLDNLGSSAKPKSAKSLETKPKRDSGGFVGKMNDHGLRTVQRWRATAQACYRRACEHDGIPADTRFAVFSKKNPYVYYYEKAYQHFLEAYEGLKVQGYVGLTTEGGRARI